MSRRTEGDGGSAEPSEEGFRNVQRLASGLQRMVNTRHASLSVLREVDQHVHRHLLEETSNILRYVDFSMRKAVRVDLKEELGQIYLSVADLLNEFKSAREQGYCSLANARMDVNPQKLNNLIDLDCELTATLSKLNDALRRVNRRSPALSDCKDLNQLVNDVFEIMSARRRLIRSHEQASKRQKR